MAAVGRTARGLRRVPSYRPPRAPQREAPPQERERKRRPVRYKLFSLGAGLDMPLLIFILVLLAIGLVMLFSASYAYSYYYYGNSYFFITRQAAFAVFGVAAMLVISTFDYHHFHKLSVVVFGIAVFLLVFLLVCRYAHIESIAPPEGDATRWLDFGIVSFQPSEIAKFGLIVLFAHMISQNLDRMGTFRYGVVPYVGIMGLVAALIFLESHLSATLIILMLGAILMFVGGTKPRWFVIGGIVLGWAWSCSAHQGRLPNEPYHHLAGPLLHRAQPGRHPPDPPVPVRHRLRRPAGRGPGPVPPKVPLSARAPERLHLRHCLRRAGHGGGPGHHRPLCPADLAGVCISPSTPRISSACCWAWASPSRWGCRRC